jgi:hypothetical protein
MRSRCSNPNHIGYKFYGGKGIRVTPEWDNFQTFYDWANANGYSDNLTIDRIDNAKDYSPSNCRWVDMKTQNNHRSCNHYLTHNGETHSISEWSELTGINRYTIWDRIVKRHWTIEDALTKPTNIKYRSKRLRG